ADHANGTAGFVELEIGVQHEPAPAAVLVAHAIFDGEIGPRREEVALGERLQVRKIAGMAARFPLDGVVADFVILETELGFPAAGKLRVARADLPRPQTDATSLEREVQLLLAFAERGDGSLAFREFRGGALVG